MVAAARLRTALGGIRSAGSGARSRAGALGLTYTTMKVELTSLLAVMAPGGTFEEHAERLAVTAQELRSASGRVLAPGDQLCGPVALELEALRPGDQRLDGLGHVLASHPPVAVTLQVSASVTVDPDHYQKRVEVRREDLYQRLRDVAKIRFSEAVAALLFAFHIAQPRTIEFARLRFIPEEPEFRRSLLPVPDWGRTFYLASEHDWPPVRRIPLSDVCVGPMASEGHASAAR
jgi:hypothetical protein